MRAPSLHRHDEQPPGAGRGGPPVSVVAIVVVIAIALVVLHLTGLLGPQSHGG